MRTDDPETGSDPDPARVPDWPELLNRYDRLVRSTCRRFALTEAESADVAQQCWLKLWEHRQNVRDARALAGWIRTTVRRDCMVVRTARWRETPEDVPVEVTLGGVEEPDPASTVVGADDRRRLRDGIRTLPQRERLLLEVLLDPREPSYSEVAQRTGMPVGSIGPVRARALRRLRVVLGEDEGPRVVSLVGR